MTQGHESGCSLDQLEASIHGELDARTLHAMEEHVTACPSCAAELAALRRERALFADRAERMEALADALWQRVERRISPAIALPRPARSRRAAWTGVLVACAAGILLCVRYVAPAGDRSRAASVRAVPASTSLPGAAPPETTDQARADGFPQRWAFAVGDRPRLTVETVAGEVKVTTGAAGRIEVVALAGSNLEPHWKLWVREKSGEVLVRLWCDASKCDRERADLRLEVHVPEATAVEIAAISADLSVLGVKAAIEATTILGEVTIEGGLGVKVETTSGDVALSRSPGGATRVETVSGDVAWEGHCAGGCALDVKTVSGDVMLDPDDSSAHRLRYKTVSGEQAGGASPRSGPGKISVETVSGDLLVGD